MELSNAKWRRKSKQLSLQRICAFLLSVSVSSAVIQLTCHAVQHRIGKRLALKQRVLATATVFLKRCCARFRTHDPRLIAVTTLFVACKAEDCVCSARAVDNAARQLAAESATPQLWPYSPEWICRTEYLVLECLEFNLIVQHPYRVVSQ